MDTVEPPAEAEDPSPFTGQPEAAVVAQLAVPMPMGANRRASAPATATNGNRQLVSVKCHSKFGLFEFHCGQYKFKNKKYAY
jgi:hypothetical protein